MLFSLQSCKLYGIINLEDKKKKLTNLKQKGSYKMTKELDIRQQIFAEFINLNEIEKAIQYAKDSELTEEEQVQALENRKEVTKMTKTYRFKVGNEVEVFTKSELIDEANDLREFLNVDGWFIEEVKTANQAISLLEETDRFYLDR